MPYASMKKFQKSFKNINYMKVKITHKINYLFLIKNKEELESNSKCS